MNERDIFIAALLKESADDRRAYLDEACHADAALRHRVESLLEVHERAGNFLEHQANNNGCTGDFTSDQGACEIPQATAEKLGTRIGPYKLLQMIGEGGMGTVYLAEQEEPVKRRVALKIIKAGMDSAQVLARFEAE